MSGWRHAESAGCSVANSGFDVLRRRCQVQSEGCWRPLPRNSIESSMGRRGCRGRDVVSIQRQRWNGSMRLGETAHRFCPVRRREPATGSRGGPPRGLRLNLVTALGQRIRDSVNLRSRLYDDDDDDSAHKRGERVSDRKPCMARTPSIDACFTHLVIAQALRGVVTFRAPGHRAKHSAVGVVALPAADHRPQRAAVR